MRPRVIVVTRGDSLLMEGVEAGIRAQGVPVFRRRPDCHTDAERIVGGHEIAVVVFDEGELSAREAACLREGMGQHGGTLLGLNLDSCSALRYRAERVVLRGLRDLLPDAAGHSAPALPGGR